MEEVRNRAIGVLTAHILDKHVVELIELIVSTYCNVVITLESVLPMMIYAKPS